MAERYLSFIISGQECALDSDRIIEVLDDILITKIPLAPEYVIGVANFRGDLVAIVDLSLFLGQGQSNLPEKAYLICSSKLGPVALKIDSIRDIIMPEKITLAEEIDAEINLPHFLGVVSGEKGLIRILDIDSILSEINMKKGD